MRVMAPFTIDHEPTLFGLLCIRDHDVTRWRLEKPNDYLRFLTYQWDLGEPFVNVEHDVEFSAGTVEELADCERDWCWCPYEGVTDPQLPHLGMTKFSARFIEATHSAWDDFMGTSEVIRLQWQRQPTWSMLDGYLFRYATGRGQLAHRHERTVVNRRPEGVERMADDSMAGFLHGA